MRAAAPLAALFALAACARDAPPAPPPVEVESDEVTAHRLSDYHPLRDISARDAMGQIPMRILVGADGRVTEARVETNRRWGGHAFPAAVTARAAEEARRWRYRPFTRNGAAVRVTFVESLGLYPPEDRPARHVPMPPFDPSFRIALQRTACLGTCPRYRVEVAADGAVLFTGEDYVFAGGVHRARIDPAAVRRLYDLARRADFFSLRDSYIAGVTDNPTYVVTVTAGGRRHAVTDYVGETVGMPSIVRELEEAIDAAAGTRRWIEGNETTVSALIAEGSDLRGAEGARMLAGAAGAGKARMVAQLLGAGAQLDGQPAALPAAAGGGNLTILNFLLARRADWSRADLHAALEAAAAGGHFDAFRLLARRGALTGLAPAEATQLLRRAAERGDARLVAVLLRLHADVNWIDPTYPNPPILANAAQAICPWDRRSPDCDPALVVLLLLRAGANPRAVNPVVPASPLTLVGDVRVARLLLAAGANPNFANYDGEPPLFSIGDEDVALAMLDAGADPRARRPADGMTLVGWARYQQWPRVLARLQAQGIRR